jgi:UPF0755 protein
MRSTSQASRGLTAVRRCATVAAALALGAACDGSSGAPVRVVIPTGSSFRVAAESLASARVIRTPRLFRAYASLGQRDRELKAGTYLFRRGESWSTLIDALTKGRGLVRSVTVPEGFALSAIVPLLAKTLDVPADSVEVAVRDTALLRTLDVPTPTLEGYLFPDTYSFPDGTTARAAVGEMVRGFERRWKPEWSQRLDSLQLTRHQVVTLASIVEKEARRADERPVIAAVYYNRLHDGMLLQADPTVQYALGRHAERVLYRDLAIDSRYNTYKYPGLPPGPIDSPGSASLEAALFPADVPYRYFVAHPDGHHEFRVTFAEHTQAREQIRREQDSRAGSARR